MAIAVRHADLEADREVLIDALKRFLDPRCDRRRFEWLYQQNPFGPAHVLLVEDSGSGEVMGVAAAFPRKFFFNGEEKTGCVLGDFCISPQHRSLGPSLHLQRALLSEVDRAALIPAYDFPSTSMMAVYRRMGTCNGLSTVRFAKPLRVDRKVAKKLKFRPVAWVVTAAANSVLRALNTMPPLTDQVGVSTHHDLCGEEFTALSREVGSRYGTCTVRSAEYLNWRYLAHPSRRYEILTARSCQKLLGYAVFAFDDEVATIADLYGVGDPPVIPMLVAQVVARALARGIATVSIPLLEGHRWTGWLEKQGFHKRESLPVIIHYPVGGETSGHSRDWLLLDGDRES